MSKFYITTPIYYVNSVPHIGHAYTTIAADVLARYHRLLGDSVCLLTGTDEHGAKVEEAARLRGETPQQFVDWIASEFRQAWVDLGISSDRFVRTTDQHHTEAVQAFVAKMHENGEIYRGVYEGLYCVGCEKFVTEDELVNGLCAVHLQPPVQYSEDTYFFRLSKYQDVLTNAILNGSDPNHYRISPPSRRNEILGKLRGGLSDLSMSRAALEWGIPVPFDPSQTIYVWVDALLSYISGIGYLDDPEQFAGWWPADIHLMAKDILWFHAVIWPAMLISVGLRPPQEVFAHGFFTINGQKMSKTLGNVISPKELVEKFGVDATRYLMLSEFPFGTDGDVSIRNFGNRYNASLANDLGNLLNRTVSMINRYYKGAVPAPSGEPTPGDIELSSLAQECFSDLEKGLRASDFTMALDGIWRLVGRANKYVEENAPWVLAKSDRDRLSTVMYNLAEALRLVALAVAPFMPETGAKIAQQLGIELEAGKAEYRAASKWGRLAPGTQVTSQPVPLFPRVE